MLDVSAVEVRILGSLIEKQLIDELNLFINPVAIGAGMRIFSARTPLKLLKSTQYASGIVVNRYEPAAR